jgi:hypothetical protein
MLAHELTEARLQPDRDYLAQVGNLLNDANADYAEFLKNNNDKDDMDELVDILQSHSNADELDLNWHVGKPNKKAVDWYIQSAIVHGDGSIDVILDPDSTIGHWGPKSFKDSVLKTLAHETIHLAQRDRMGADKYAKLPSGYMQGVRKAEKSGNERDMRYWLVVILRMLYVIQKSIGRNYLPMINTDRSFLPMQSRYSNY